MSGAIPSEIRMGNDICRAFGHLPDDAATAAVAGHLTRFWDPRMREAIFSHVAGGGEGLDPPVRKAIDQLRSA